jgi:hypothetical protein
MPANTRPESVRKRKVAQRFGNRTTITFSITAPPQWVERADARAAELGLNRSVYKNRYTLPLEI